MADTDRPVQSRMETRCFKFKKKRDCTICVAKKGADQLCSAVTAQLICVFVFEYADCWFSGALAQISNEQTALKTLTHKSQTENSQIHFGFVLSIQQMRKKQLIALMYT